MWRKCHGARDDRQRLPSVSMFDSLSDRLGATLDGLKGRGRLSEDDINKAMREIRLALLEADVNFGVVKDFVARVKERAMGSEVMDSLTPGQQVVKIVHEELTILMGEAGTKLSFSNRPPTVILMAGLQGSGKTTACGKLARLLATQKKAPPLGASGVFRPPACAPSRRTPPLWWPAMSIVRPRSSSCRRSASRSRGPSTSGATPIRSRR